MKQLQEFRNQGWPETATPRPEIMSMNEQPNLEWVSEMAANDFDAVCEFEDMGETTFDADIGGIDGWSPDNIIISATLEVWDGEGDSHSFELDRADLVQVLGLHAVRNLENAENERALSA